MTLIWTRSEPSGQLSLYMGSKTRRCCSEPGTARRSAAAICKKSF